MPEIKKSIKNVYINYAKLKREYDEKHDTELGYKELAAFVIQSNGKLGSKVHSLMRKIDEIKPNQFTIVEFANLALFFDKKVDELFSKYTKSV